MAEQTFPAMQAAVQLTGPGRVVLNPEKFVAQPGPHQALMRTEAVGLCFSDMKLLKQFDEHPRKAGVIDGVEASVLKQIASYVPGEAPTVPGHEAVVRVVAVGPQTSHFKVGERYLIQADFRNLKTAGSNGAFGYNFEGALQEYVLVDERVVFDAAGSDPYIIPAPDNLGASSVALVEPWACVENSYRSNERQGPLEGGRMLVVADRDVPIFGLVGSPAQVHALVTDEQWPEVDLGTSRSRIESLDVLPDAAYDDIVYFGSRREVIEALDPKLAEGGIANVVLCGRTIGEPVTIGLGRVHYAGTRWVGCCEHSAGEGYAMIPPSCELRTGDRVLVMGAGGPMGQMHTLRAVSIDLEGLMVVGADVDDARLEALAEKVEALGAKHPFRRVNTRASGFGGDFDYFAVMAPMVELVAQAVAHARPGAIVNIFAGIPAPVKGPLDLDAVIRKRVYVYGTSGSETSDMRAVLAKVVESKLNTDASVDAVSGMAGAVDGLRAVEERTMAGKIVVYPSLRNLPLTPLSELAAKYPSVAEKLRGGQWTPEAEAELLRVAN